MSIRAVMSRPVGALATTLAVGVVLSAAPAAGQPEADLRRFLLAYDAVEESKRRFSETMLGFVADLGVRAFKVKAVQFQVLQPRSSTRPYRSRALQDRSPSHGSMGSKDVIRSMSNRSTNMVFSRAVVSLKR